MVFPSSLIQYLLLPAKGKAKKNNITIYVWVNSSRKNLINFFVNFGFFSSLCTENKRYFFVILKIYMCCKKGSLEIHCFIENSIYIEQTVILSVT